MAEIFHLKGLENLISRISRLSALNPLAISITWGAGGSTKDRSLELANFTQTDCRTDTILHLTCTNMRKGMVDDVLKVLNLSCGLHVTLIPQSDCERNWHSEYPSTARRCVRGSTNDSGAQF